MFDKIKQCNLSSKMMIRLNNFLYVFNLRQGTILIAIHQIALSSFVLILLIVGISHAGEMLNMLHEDMEDDAERRGFYDVGYGMQLTFHEGEVLSTNNQRRFAKAQRLATETVIFLYTSTILNAIYLMCCISLLHGALHNRYEYTLPWLAAAVVASLILALGTGIGESYPYIVNLFGGPCLYLFSSGLILVTFLYAIFTVSSFALEMRGRCERATSDERGERMLLLDHAAHSSLLSAAQLNKLSHGTGSQFV